MDRATKHAFVKEFGEVLSTQSLLVVTRQTGLSVGESEALRGKVRESGASFKIVKNTLLRLVLTAQNANELSDQLKGPTGLAYSEDPIAAAKAVVSFAKDNKKLEVVAGVLNGAYLEAKAVKELAALPSLDALRGKIVGLVSAPLQGLVRTIGAPGSGLARLVSAYSEKQQ